MGKILIVFSQECWTSGDIKLITRITTSSPTENQAAILYSQQILKISLYTFLYLFINFNILYFFADDVVRYDVLLLPWEPLHGEPVHVQQLPETDGP